MKKETIKKVEKKSTAKKKTVEKVETKNTVKKIKGIEKIFLNKKSSFFLEKGEYPKSKIEKNPDLFFDSIINAQQQAINYLDEIKGEMKHDEYTEIFYRIKNFS